MSTWDSLCVRVSALAVRWAWSHGGVAMVHLPGLLQLGPLAIPRTTSQWRVSCSSNLGRPGRSCR